MLTRLDCESIIIIKLDLVSIITLDMDKLNVWCCYYGN